MLNVKKKKNKNSFQNSCPVICNGMKELFFRKKEEKEGKRRRRRKALQRKQSTQARNKGTLKEGGGSIEAGSDA